MKSYQFVKRSGRYTFNKQCSIVYHALRALDSGTLPELASKCVELGLRTRQDPERIVAYYMVELRKLGLVLATGTSARKVTVVIGEEDGNDDGVISLDDESEIVSVDEDAPDA